MYSKFLKVAALIALVAMAFQSCGKDDDPKGNPYNGKTTSRFDLETTYGSLTDQEGNIYKTVTIGTQTWMAENLRTTKYNDGSAIPEVTNFDKWKTLSTGAYCNYNNMSDADFIATFGRLYNWHAVNTGKLAPIGWHVPTNAEWVQLINNLGGADTTGGKLKETTTKHWVGPNTAATNITGFTALPGGGRFSDGSCGDADKYGYWWSSTADNTGNAWTWILSYNLGGIRSQSNARELGFSVRCVKDE